MRVIRIGHGGRPPEIGEEFFLRTWASRSGRVRFSCATIIGSGDQGATMVGYSIRSSANLIPFALGQVWLVRAVRMRQAARRDVRNRQWVFARIDLQEAYELFVGHYDIYDRRWKAYQHENMLAGTVLEVPASVRYQKYQVELPDGIQVGTYPEVIDAESGRIIVRFSPDRLRACSEEEDAGIPLFPTDGTPLSRERDPRRYVSFIKDPL